MTCFQSSGTYFHLVFENDTFMSFLKIDVGLYKYWPDMMYKRDLNVHSVPCFSCHIFDVKFQ